ncbi:MAG: hypothetical protein K2R98_16110 [Gemmataceae bacterium]|nr:hypothetical protein [Gemmataceae bacterium]
MANESGKAISRGTVVRNYEYFCLAALLVLLLLLFQRGIGLTCLLPFLIGLGGIAGRWRLALPALLVSLAFVVTDTWLSNSGMAGIHQDDALNDFLLCAAVLGYAAGQMRLQGVAGQLLPPDSRVTEPASKAKDATEKPGRQADYARELLILGVSLVFWAGVAPLVWELLPGRVGLAIAPRVWRLIVLGWLLILGLIVAGGLLRGLGRDARKRDEAILFLQDILWRETRREQARVQRWQAWRRLRAQRRRKEIP